MQRRGLLILALSGAAGAALIAGAVAFSRTAPPPPKTAGSTELAAQPAPQQVAQATPQAAPQPPSPTATISLPSAGPPDPNLRIVNLPGGRKLHLLPATLETTQWGWFDNAQPPVLRINSGDTVVLE